MKIRILMLLLTVALLLGALPLNGSAAEIVWSGTSGENLTWTLDSDGLLIISGTGAMEDYYGKSGPWCWASFPILSVVVEEGITSIGSSAFIGCDKIRSVTLPSSVTTIGSSAFEDCYRLSSITIPGGVTSIGSSAFSGCTSLSSITIPDSVTTIGDSAFDGCASLSSIAIPEGVTTIGEYTFYNCASLSSITLPNSVTTIGGGAFSYCTNLSSITIPEGVTSIGGSAFSGCASLRSITIPDSVTAIGVSAFSDCSSLSSITVPEGVTTIGEYTFYNCASLSSITLPESLLLAHSSAFSGCSNLSTVHYAGTQERAEEISVVSDDYWYLSDVTWHYECDCIQFGDVAEDAYYYKPVLWAVENGITNGLSKNTFGPDATCTRAQIVTFLWRANGSPASGGTNPFTDVPVDAWYTNAVLWAVENGITTGTSATTFSPDAGCTRGQVATFLWRSQRQPSVNGENIFTDIAYGAYYYDAVLWAVANGITNGMGEGLFAPDATCTRGQIVTFLYRAMAK